MYLMELIPVGVVNQCRVDKANSLFVFGKGGQSVEDDSFGHRCRCRRCAGDLAGKNCRGLSLVIVRAVILIVEAREVEQGGAVGGVSE